jgi:dipeptidase
MVSLKNHKLKQRVQRDKKTSYPDIGITYRRLSFNGCCYCCVFSIFPIAGYGFCISLPEILNLHTMRSKIISLLCLLVIFIFGSSAVKACTNVLVSKGASKDGSVMITYNADAGGFMEPLYFMDAKDWGAKDSLDIYEWDTGKFLGRIKQVAHTYKVIGNMNENQVAIGETTYGGRDELQKPNGILDYGSLMYIALQRAKTAREAIKIMTDLANQYGYVSEGESMSVSDANEAWIFEIIGKGLKEKGVVWAACKVPEGYICAHANQARIREVPVKDKENCMYAKDLFTFAEKEGYWNPKSGKNFSFVDAYCPLTPEGLFLCEDRIWSIFRRAAPSLNLSSDYWRGVKDAVPYPLFIKPDKKLSVQDVMALMRDHFEGTDFDMTKGLMAGPFGCPYRWKSLYFQAPGDTVTKYGWERPISTQQTAFSFVAQSRSFLSNAVGGIFWYSVDDTYSNCYMPLYCCMLERPKPFAKADVTKYDPESAAWIFNLTANYAYTKYSYIIKDIQAVQKELEGNFFELQPAVEKTALELEKTDTTLAIQYLSDYSITHAKIVVDRWQELYEYIVTRYNDGYINDGKDGGRHPKGVGYGSAWIQRVLKEQPEYYKVEWDNPVKK